MTCRVPDFTEVVQFHCNGSSRGACTIFGCSPNMIEEGGNTVILQIPSMSYSNDACEWTCTYGATSSPATKLIIYSKYWNYIIRICGIKKKIKKLNMVSVTCHCQFYRLNARQLFDFPMYFFLNAVKHKNSNNCNLISNCHHNYTYIHLNTLK